MKGDIILKVLVNLLMPFLLLYGFLVLFNYKYMGFFAIVNSLIIFIAVYVLYYIKYGELKANKIIPFKVLGLVILFVFMLYIVYIMFMLFNVDLFELCLSK